MNSVIHLAALVALAGLAFLWIRARRRHEFLRLIFGLGAGKAILVEWPDKFIRSLAEACGILISGNSSAKGVQPVTIDLREWQVFFRNFKVNSFHLDQAAPQTGVKLVIEAVVEKGVREVSDEEVWGRRLSQALGQTVVVQFAVPGKP